MVNKQVCAHVVEKLNSWCSEGKMTCMYPRQTKLKAKGYMKNMATQKARLLFCSKIKDDRLERGSLRSYMHEDIYHVGCGERMKNA